MVPRPTAGLALQLPTESTGFLPYPRAGHALFIIVSSNHRVIGMQKRGDTHPFRVLAPRTR